MHGGAQNGPFGTIDIIGMRTAYNILDYWGKENGDDQMLANAAYIKEHFVDKGLLGLQTGQGYYSYPDPAYRKAGFLDVPDISSANEISSMAAPK